MQNGGQIYHRSGLFSPLLSFVYLHVFPCRSWDFGDGALGEDTVWRALKAEDFFPLAASPVVGRPDGFPGIWTVEADGDWLGAGCMGGPLPLPASSGLVDSPTVLTRVGGGWWGSTRLSISSGGGELAAAVEASRGKRTVN
ncbi:unnamed protein product [Linum trigynum]|uniref:Uncharacterized protein n=1 Tax=Linum trigynum TaxID=586398 RepID=A0AAV2CI47_9ROSI